MIKIFFLILLISLVLGDTNSTQSQVKGGVTAQPGEFPYQVSVQVDETHIGGGVLISTKHVLTSASCVTPIVKNPNLLIPRTKILAGTISLKTDGYYFGVSRISIHPEYHHSDIFNPYINDIGVIHLDKEVPITYWIKPINLPSITEVSDNAKLMFTGWGNTQDPTSPTVELLKKTVLQHVTKQVCQEYFVDRRVMDSQLCTSANYVVGTCTTDTGSPLVFNNEVIGISTGFHGCARGIPDVFTKVSSYLKYIHNEIDFITRRENV